MVNTDSNNSYNDETGIYTITKSIEDFKILHLNDIHIGGTLNTGLFMIDSNIYTGEGINVYNNIHDDQVEA